MNAVAAMRRCLELAERGRGRVGNGALVGAVLVRDGVVVETMAICVTLICAVFVFEN
jgi:pyrimidine deaminase RibD-like protein